nr:PREDICTED: uncharacterized protein LOC105677588 [Linepithema humile]
MLQHKLKKSVLSVIRIVSKDHVFLGFFTTHLSAVLLLFYLSLILHCKIIIKTSGMFPRCIAICPKLLTKIQEARVYPRKLKFCALSFKMSLCRNANKIMTSDDAVRNRTYTTTTLIKYFMKLKNL